LKIFSKTQKNTDDTETIKTDKMKFSIEHIECDSCYQILQIIYVNSHNQIKEESYSKAYLTDDGILCGNCVCNCVECNVYINSNYEHCESCDLKKFIKTTNNTITKKLPLELVLEILKYI